ncbi:transposable element Tcb2 transposase [Trichonephila clavipes]|nr:transposable element Tcb2 transposase [Trichonephila clavipes]
MLPGSSISLTALFHGCGSHLKTPGMCSRRHGGGRVRSTTPAEDRYIVLSAKGTGAPQLSRWQISFLLPQEKQISRKTVARRLRGGGLYARRPVVCVPLTRQHRTARLQWCREHHNWTEQDWACVLFSDEVGFSLSSDCRRQLIWRESGTAYRPENIQEKDRYPTCSIMVWAGIMTNGRTCLHVVANGTMTGQRYIDEVLLPHVRLFRGAVGDKFVFMDDNATCHRTLAVQECLRQRGQVSGRNYPPTNKNTLIRALTEEWDKLPQQPLDKVVQTTRAADLKSATKTFQILTEAYGDETLSRAHVFEWFSGGRDNVEVDDPAGRSNCQVIYSQFGLAIYENDHQARRRFVEWAQNEIAVVADFHKQILFSDEAHFWLNGYVNKQNCRIWSEANPQVYVETPLHPEKLTVWCALWAGGILLQKR